MFFHATTLFAEVYQLVNHNSKQFFNFLTALANADNVNN